MGTGEHYHVLEWVDLPYDSRWTSHKDLRGPRGSIDPHYLRRLVRRGLFGWYYEDTVYRTVPENLLPFPPKYNAVIVDSEDHTIPLSVPDNVETTTSVHFLETRPGMLVGMEPETVTLDDITYLEYHNPLTQEQLELLPAEEFKKLQLTRRG